MKTSSAQKTKPSTCPEIRRIRCRRRCTSGSALNESIREFHCSPPERAPEKLEIMSEVDKEIYERPSEH